MPQLDQPITPDADAVKLENQREDRRDDAEKAEKAKLPKPAPEPAPRPTSAKTNAQAKQAPANPGVKPTAPTQRAAAETRPRRDAIQPAIHRRVPYLNRPVTPAAAAMRAVRAYEPRLAGEDRREDGQENSDRPAVVPIARIAPAVTA